MVGIEDVPLPLWLVQEPEGPAAPKTPGRWKSMWASDCTRLEEAHKRGDPEQLVFGRKYVVDMKERTVRSLYFKEKPETRPVMRATYFVKQNNGWLPYSEKDAVNLEIFYNHAKEQLESGQDMEPEIRLDDEKHRVVMKKQLKAINTLEQQSEEFDIVLQQTSIKAPSMLATTFTKTAFGVQRGNPDPGKWGGIPSSEGDDPRQAAPPKHLVFVVHGIGESLWARPSSSLGSLRQSCTSMRKMTAIFLDGQLTASREEQPQGTSNNSETYVEEDGIKDSGGVTDNEGGQKADTDFIEFLPVEWYEEVHGEGVLENGLIQDITLDAIPVLRDFANQAMMDVMMYLTPNIQAKILLTVASELNRMWDVFFKYTPGFTGKVSILTHSLGSIIAHDVFMAQPKRGETTPVDGPGGAKVPIIKFDPEVLLTCGSPIGTFLSLRASRLDRDNLFNFKTVKRFFNLFHMHDPVAYRLEPLLDRRLRDLPPEHVPHKGGDRINVVVKKFNRGMYAAIDRVQKNTADGFSRVQTNLASTVKSMIGNAGSASEEPETPKEEVKDAREKLRERIDWAIQESVIEGMHPWASAIFAHSSYFQNLDMIMFLINTMEEERSQDEPPNKQP